MPDPTPAEAADEYAYYKYKYSNAAEQKYASERQEEAYYEQKNAAASQLSDATSRKLNFEKRLEGIGNIIKMMEGGGGLFSTDVPGAISKTASKLQDADRSYKSCIRDTTTAAASLEAAFETKTVEGDANSSSALQQFRAEKTRLEQALEEIRSQIASLSSTISSLNSMISSCDSYQSYLRSVMNNCTCEMDYYRRYMD